MSTDETHSAGLVLFIFGVTAGSVNGWTSARCLAPLIVSVFPMTAFFFWEARLPEEQAAMYVSTRNYCHRAHIIPQSSKSLASEKLHGPCCGICDYALLVVWSCAIHVLMGLAKRLSLVSHNYCPSFVSSFIEIADYVFRLTVKKSSCRGICLRRDPCNQLSPETFPVEMGTCVCAIHCFSCHNTSDVR